MRRAREGTGWMVAAGIMAATALGPMGASAQAPPGAQAAVAAPAAQEWQPDQMCLVRWTGTEYWFGARIVAREPDGRYQVHYFEGGRATVSPEDIRPERLAVGDSVHAIWKREEGSDWYRAIITERRGMIFVLQYGDGGQETTSLEWMRVPADVAAPSSH